MIAESHYLIAADLLLLGHVLFVGFVVVGLLLVIMGKGLHWSWIRNPWFRLLHLASIAFVVLLSWLSRICPITTWEMLLRERGGGSTYSGSFISYWLETLLYYDAPEWVFVMLYTFFGIAVLAAWYWIRPYPFKQRQEHR